MERRLFTVSSGVVSPENTEMKTEYVLNSGAWYWEKLDAG